MEIRVQSVRDENWQKIRQSMLKTSLEFKYDTLEKWLEKNYLLKHVSGCKSYDFTDDSDSTILYDEKTFTKLGCNFCPSNMKGQGRKFNKEVFEEKTKKLIFCIVSNVNFPEIKIRFVKGAELFILYPNGKIPLNDHIKFFN